MGSDELAQPVNILNSGGLRDKINNFNPLMRKGVQKIGQLRLGLSVPACDMASGKESRGLRLSHCTSELFG